MKTCDITGAWAIPAAFAAAAVVLFAPGLFGGEIPVFRDLLVLVIPLRHFAREAVRSGSIPLWTNDLFFGAPFLANAQSAIFYPPSLLIYALPFSVGLTIYLAFHVFLAGWGTARYLRRHARLGALESAFGGLVFCAGGYFFSLTPLTNQLAAVAWLPWVLTAAEDLLSTGEPRSFVGLTVALAMQILCGAPEPVLITAGLATLIGARNLLRREHAWKRCLAVGLSYVAAASLCAAQVLPTVEYVLQSDRAQGLSYQAVTAESIAPRSLLQLAIPHTFANGALGFMPEGRIPLLWSLYLGIIPLALALVALARRPSGLWSVVSYASLALAFGSHTPLLRVLYEALPRAAGLFRFPAKFFVAAHFAASLFAAHGLADVVEKRGPHRAATAVLGILGALSAGFAIAAHLAPSQLLAFLGFSIPAALGESVSTLLASREALVALRSAGFAVAGVIALRWSRGVRDHGVAVAVSVIALSGADLLLVHGPSLVFSPWRDLLRSGAERASTMPAGARVFHYCIRSPGCVPDGAPGIGPWTGGLRPGESVAEQAAGLWSALVPDAPMVYGLDAVGGSDGLSTMSQQEVFRQLALLPRDRAIRLLASLGVSYMVGPEPLASDPQLRAATAGSSESPYWQYAIESAAPRTYLAERTFTADEPAAALDLVSQPSFRPGRDAVLVPGGTAVDLGRAAGTIEQVVYGSRSLEARVRVSAPTLWVVSETWFPGWEASVDGMPAPLLRVNGICRGVIVPAGAHRVEMRYRPRVFGVGCALSFVTIVALAAVLVKSR